MSLLLQVLLISTLIVVLLGSGLFMYIGAMGVKRAWKTLSIPVRASLALPLLFAYIYDILILNVVLGTVYFQEAPRELTLSERLDRWATSGDANQNLKAQEVCRLLNKFDPSGHHCGKIAPVL